VIAPAITRGALWTATHALIATRLCRRSAVARSQHYCENDYRHPKSSKSVIKQSDRGPRAWGPGACARLCFIHNTPTRTDQTQTKREGRTPRTRHSRFILMLATCNMYRAHRHGSESPYPGSTRVNPGSEPVQPPRLAGVWTAADTHTGMVWHGMAWYGQGFNDASSACRRETGRR